MKFKKIMLVSIILLAILTIGAVSASGDVASDDSAAVSDGDSIGSSVDNTDLLSNDDDDDGDGGDDEGADDSEEGGDDDDEWEGLLFFEENAIDIQDNDTIVASVFCPENTTGIFCALITDDDECEIGHAHHLITEEDWNTQINFTVEDLNIESTGYFGIDIFLLEDLKDHGDYEFCIGGEDVYIVDSTQFRVEMEYGENINFLHEGALFALYCPDGHVGEIVNVAVTYEDETVEIFYKAILYDGGDWISFKADELNISLDYEADYEICLTVNDGEFHEDFSLSIVHPIIITNDGYYAESLLRWDRQLASVTIPTNVAENNRKSRILLYIDGEVKFNKTLSEFKFVENATEEDPYWYNPSWGPGPGDERFMSFAIEAEAVEGNATVEVFLMLEDGREFSLSDDVEFKDTFAIAHESGSIIQFTNFEVEVGSDEDIAVLFVPEDLNVTVIVKADGEVVFSGLDELDAHEGLLFIQACNLDIEEEGDYEIDVALLLNGKTIVNLTADVSFYFYIDDDDDWDDAENGIIVGVYEGPEEDEEDTVFFLDDEALRDRIFAYVSVSDYIQGNIAVVTYLEDDEIVFFNKDISEIENYEEDDENEGFTIYYLSLGDLEDFETFLEQDHFTLVFFAEDDDEEGHDYSINIDEGALTFYCIDEEWPEAEGEQIAVEFRSANTVTNDAIVIIPKDNLDDEIDDEFTVTIYCDDEFFQTELCLSELESDDNAFMVRLSNLTLPEDIGESRGIGILVQFYIDGEGAFFAEPEEDDDNLYLFTSPFLRDDAFLLSNDWVFSFRFHEEADDAFLVNVTNMDNGNSFLVPFSFSDFEFEDSEAIAEITLSDLNITEEGQYHVEVVFTADGEELAKACEIVGVYLLDVVENDLEDDDMLNDVTDHVFTVRVAEDFEGYALIYVDDVEVKNISLADLGFSDIPPFQGRKIALNDFAITEEGDHSLRVEVYNANGDLLRESERSYYVAVGENGVEFRNIAFGGEIADAIQFNIGTPLPNGAYFNITVNGKKAAKYTVTDGFEFLSEEFVIPLYDVSLWKSGDYVVNVTYCDGENETFFASGEFSVNTLLLTKDKLLYYEGETAKISFALADPSKSFGKLRGSYIYNAGPIGWDDEMAFNTYSGDEICEFWKDGVVTIPFEDLEAGIYFIYVSYDLAASEDDYENEFNVTYSGGLIAVEVLKKIDPIFKVDVEDIEYGKNATVVVTAHDEFTGTVNVTIGTLTFPVELVNGTGSTVVPNLDANAYDAAISYKGNFKYIAGDATDAFKVSKISSAIDVDDVEMVYGTPFNLTINTIGALGFKVELDGKEIIADGKIVILPANLTVGTHTLTITTTVDLNHIALSKNVTVNVKLIPTIISAVYKTTTYGTAGKIIVKLTDELGIGLPLENVTVTLNKVTYTGVTNLTGEVVINTPKTLPADKYTADLAFAGCIIHDATTGKVNVVVNKAANTWKVKGKVLKIKASKVAKKAVSFKASKVMKYRKGQGTLIFKKVKGNSKIVINKKNGKVLIKKGLKKGIYTVKVKTKAYGNKNYKASAVQTVVFKIKIV